VTRRALGVAMVAIGAALLVVGVVAGVAGLIDDDGDGDQSAPATSSASAVTVPATTMAPAATTAAPTTAAPTSTTASSTTMAEPTTSTTAPVSPQTRVVEFAAQLAGFIESDDLERAFETLHPAVVAAGGADLCRSWIEREILAVEGYRLLDDPDGPTSQTITNADGSTVRIDGIYSVAVSFEFGGETFESDAGFAVEPEDIWWLGVCR
jgi:hypothetical protein